MIVNGHIFKPVSSHYDGVDPTVFLYKHLTSGKYFVGSRVIPFKSMLHTRIPKTFKDYVSENPSETLLYACEFKGATQKDLVRITAEFNKYFFANGSLIEKRLLRHNDGITKQSQYAQTFFVYTATDTATKAKYLFVSPATHSLEKVFSSFNAKLVTHNTHVTKKIKHVNRTMHEYTRIRGMLSILSWTIEREPGLHLSEASANRELIRLCRDHLRCNRVVLNRISDHDVIYYRNEIMKYVNMCMYEYLDLCSVRA